MRRMVGIRTASGRELSYGQQVLIRALYRFRQLSVRSLWLPQMPDLDATPAFIQIFRHKPSMAMMCLVLAAG